MTPDMQTIAMLLRGTNDDVLVATDALRENGLDAVADRILDTMDAGFLNLSVWPRKIELMEPFAYEEPFSCENEHTLETTVAPVLEKYSLTAQRDADKLILPAVKQWNEYVEAIRILK